MPLEQHRSSLIPTVSFAAGGRIMVDGEATFPRSYSKASKDKRAALPDFAADAGLDDNDNELVDDSDLESFRSYDPKRKPRFVKRDSSHYETEVNKISGTLSSGGSQSLQRKLRRFRGSSRDPSDELESGPEFGSLNLTGTVSDRGRTRRSNSYVQPNPYPGSLGRSSSKQKNKQRLGTLSRNSKKPAMEEVYSKDGSAIYSNGHLADIPETVAVRNKKMAEETLPSVYFMIIGGIMFVLALVNLCLSWWHSYYAPLWTSIIMFQLGVSGLIHRGDYLTKWSNALYIVFGFLTVISALVCSGVILDITASQVAQRGSGFDSAIVASLSNKTNQGQSLVGNIGADKVVDINIGLGYAILTLCMASFYSISGTIVAISNHWDAVYTVTGDCDHRGNPRFFNPAEQAILGLIACFIGLFPMAFTGYSADLYGMPAIAGGLVMAASFASFAYGKRPDLIAWGLSSLILEFAALLMCGAATVFLTLALVQDSALSRVERPTGQYESLTGLVHPDIIIKSIQSEAIVSLVTIGLYFFFMIVNVIFASGILFRICRKACCLCFIDDPLVHDTRF